MSAVPKSAGAAAPTPGWEFSSKTFSQMLVKCRVLLLPGGNGLPNIGVKAVGKKGHSVLLFALVWFLLFHNSKIGK